MIAVLEGALDHPGLAVLGLLALGLGLLWLVRRLRRVVALVVLIVALAAALPGPRSAGVAAVGVGDWHGGIKCLQSAAGEAGIWRSQVDAKELPACRDRPSADSGPGRPRRADGSRATRPARGPGGS